MTKTTTTTYQILSHAYTTDMGGKVQCDDRQACTVRRHWSETAEYDTLPEAREHWNGDDAPAIRIRKVTTVETVEEIERIVWDGK